MAAGVPRAALALIAKAVAAERKRTVAAAAAARKVLVAVPKRQQ
jgi:hypothetical protein